MRGSRRVRVRARTRQRLHPILLSIVWLVFAIMFQDVFLGNKLGSLVIVGQQAIEFLVSNIDVIFLMILGSSVSSLPRQIMLEDSHVLQPSLIRCQQLSRLKWPVHNVSIYLSVRHGNSELLVTMPQGSDWASTYLSRPECHASSKISRIDT